MQLKVFSFVLVTALFFTRLVEAHTGLAGVTGGGFATGFIHPLIGVDHLLAMTAVGIWAAQAGGRFLWLAPLTFMLMMAAGGTAGIAKPSLPLIELGIAGSLAVFGLAIAAAWKPAPLLGMLIIGLFAFFHGHAHGTEMELTASPLLYALGFTLATGLLHLAGIAIGTELQSRQFDYVTRFAGAGIALAGAALIIV